MHFSIPVNLRRLARSLRDHVMDVLRRATDERIPQVAGSLTFTTVLALVPLFVMVFALLTAFPVFEQMRAALREVLLENLVPPTFADTIFNYLNQFASKARNLTIVGLVSLGVTSMALVLTIDRSMNAIWHVRRHRPIGQSLLIYGVVIVLGPVVLGGSLALTSYAWSSFGLAARPPWPLKVALEWLPLFTSVAGFAALYRYVPYRFVAWRDALIGALFAALCFELAKRGFALYVTRFTVYSRLYGALSLMPIFLLWLYLSWLITLAGALVASSGPLWQHAPRVRARTPGANLAEALLMLRAMATQDDPLKLERLASAARIPVGEAEALLDVLEFDGVVRRIAMRRHRRLKNWTATDGFTLALPLAQIYLDTLAKCLVYDGDAVVLSTLHLDDPLTDTLRGLGENLPRVSLEQLFAPTEPRA